MRKHSKTPVLVAAITLPAVAASSAGAATINVNTVTPSKGRVDSLFTYNPIDRVGAKATSKFSACLRI